MSPEQFQQRLLAWFDRCGRKDLPWQHPITPYRVWLSEVMLQQTQVATVVPYFERFVDAFPDIEALASADIDQVLHLWTGLGYYARGRNLHQAARVVMEQHQGQLPDTLEQLEALPGIGRSTAGAILSIAFHRPTAILDGNVKRVLSRFAAVQGWPGRTAVSRQLWQLAERYTPQQRCADYTQAIMDLGATLCNRSAPRCDECPLQADCLAWQQGEPKRYPSPKPKKALPVKQCWMVVLQDAKGQVLLEQRPPTGLWGGLWCLPQFDSLGQMQDWLKQQGAEGDQQMPAFKHSFSHYQLQIQPMQARLAQAGSELRDQASLWYRLDQPQAVGLAAPVKRLLGQLVTG